MQEFGTKGRKSLFEEFWNEVENWEASEGVSAKKVKNYQLVKNAFTVIDLSKTSGGRLSLKEAAKYKGFPNLKKAHEHVRVSV